MSPYPVSSNSNSASSSISANTDTSRASSPLLKPNRTILITGDESNFPHVSIPMIRIQDCFDEEIPKHGPHRIEYEAQDLNQLLKNHRQKYPEDFRIKSDSESTEIVDFGTKNKQIVKNSEKFQPFEGSFCRILFHYMCETFLMIGMSTLAFIYVLMYIGLTNADEKPVVAKSLGSTIVMGDSLKSGYASKKFTQFTNSSFIEPKAEQVDYNTFGDVSLGSGFWLQQFTHITGHLLQYLELREDFQIIFASRQIGKIMEAYVDVYEAEEVFTLSIDYRLIGAKTQFEPKMQNDQPKAAKKHRKYRHHEKFEDSF